jgi:hypothetical protein
MIAPAPPSAIERTIVLVVPIAVAPRVTNAPRGSEAIAVTPSAGPIATVVVATCTVAPALIVTVAVTLAASAIGKISISITIGKIAIAVSFIQSPRYVLPASLIAVAAERAAIAKLATIPGLANLTIAPFFAHLQKVADLFLTGSPCLILLTALIERATLTIRRSVAHHAAALA